MLSRTLPLDFRLLLFVLLVGACHVSGAQPLLEARTQPDQRLVLEWASSGAPVLESAEALAGQWLGVPEPPEVAGGRALLVLPAGSESRFFRLRWVTPTTVEGTSPGVGETGVAVTRETTVRFTAPLGVGTLLAPGQFRVEADGRQLLSRVELGSDRRSVTLFPLEPMPANARIQIRLDGAGLRDEAGAEVDLDRDGQAGGTLGFAFSTASITPVPNTAVSGHVYASEPNPDGSNRPLAGVVVTVDGAEESLRTTTDPNGFF